MVAVASGMDAHQGSPVRLWNISQMDVPKITGSSIVRMGSRFRAPSMAEKMMSRSAWLLLLVLMLRCGCEGLWGPWEWRG